MNREQRELCDGCQWNRVCAVSNNMMIWEGRLCWVPKGCLDLRVDGETKEKEIKWNNQPR